MNNRRWLYIFLIVLPAGLSAQNVDHWEMVVDASDTWRYFVGTTEPPADWNTETFDESSWPQGPGGFGYGDGDDGTTIQNTLSVYLRIRFTINDLSKISMANLHMDFDDGFVAYLNGVQFASMNVGATGHDQSATDLHEALLYQGIAPEVFQVPMGQLNDGENTLAIQVHNFNITSSDMTSNAFLMLGMNEAGTFYRPPPSWFEDPGDFSSTLPLVMINTNGQSILPEDRIIAEMGTIDNGPGVENSVGDAFNDFHGLIHIETRGESTQGFPKKSYGFETQDSTGANLNTQLLGLPTENDWVLYAPYSDKSLVRNVLTFRMARDSYRYASRTRYCELFLNGQYQGVYVLMEKIKRDNDRIDIDKLLPEDVSGDELTGGYVLRVDKIDFNDYPDWLSTPDPMAPGEGFISFQYFDPDGFELQQVQRDYIRNFIEGAESVLNSSTFLDTQNGYRKYFDIGSFIDYLLINEVTQEVDSYVFSTYLYKERDSDGGKIHMGPIWDFNLGYGNVDYYPKGLSTQGWVYEDGGRMYWFRRMMQDPLFESSFNCRWHDLRNGLWSDDVIFSYFDSLTNALTIPAQRNFERWPILGLYIWPNTFIGNTYAEEVGWLRDWLDRRLTWMDANIEECILGTEEQTIENDILIYPNPFSDKLNVQTRGNHGIRSVQIYDLSGRMVFQRLFINRMATVPLDIPDIRSGTYILRLEMTNGDQISRRIIKQ